MDGGAGTDTVQVNGSPTGDDQYLIQVIPPIQPGCVLIDKPRPL